MGTNKALIKMILTVFLGLTSCLWAVTPDEIEKMRSAMPAEPVVEPAQPRTMLVFSLCNGFKHDCIPYWNQALDVMSETTGAFTVVHSTDMAVFTPESLKRFDVICLNNTTKLTPNKAQQNAIMDFIRSGKGIVGIHAATDNFYEWPEGMAMMGGVFTGHPWTAGGTWAVKLDEPDHPLMASFKGQNFRINDEIYRTDPPLYSRDKQRVLMSLDMSDPVTQNAKDVKPDDKDTGISWIKRVGKGRLFYCSLGHNNHLTWNPAVLGHYLAGIQYAAGDYKVDDSLKASPDADTLSALDGLIEQVRQKDWDNRDAAAQLDLQIRTYYDDAAALAAIEQKLLAALDSAITPAGIDTICRRLAVIGTDQSLPVLSQLLTQPQASAPALYALENIPGEAVDAALVKTALSTSDTALRIGIITTLGVRKSDGVIALSKPLFNDTTDIAIMQALGSVGTEAAAAELSRIGSMVRPDAAVRWADAMLMCAEALRQAGHPAKAAALYQNLYQTHTASLIQGAALVGWAGLDADGAQTVVRAAIEGDDPILQAAGIRALPALHTQTALLKQLAASAAGLPAGVQIPLVTAMAQTSQAIGRDLALVLLDSDTEAVRTAACAALEQCGDASVRDRLAFAASRAQSRSEQQAAQRALYRIPGKAFDTAILRAIADYQDSLLDDKALVELIKAAVARHIVAAPEVLFRTATAESRSISAESIRALQSLAGPEYMEELVSLLTAAPSAATEKAVILAGEQITPRDGRAMILLDKYPKMAGHDNAQVSMLNVMGQLGDPRAVSLLEREFESTNPAIQQAAFRAMANWPGDQFTDRMKTLAQSDADLKTRILAFRAYLERLRQNTGDHTAADLIAAYAFAPRVDEQKIVIGALGSTDSADALAFVQDKLQDAALKAEAQAAAMGICEKRAASGPSGVRPILEILSRSDSESVRNRAKELLAELPH